MKPAPFAYQRPSSLAEAIGLLAEPGEETKALAGGQSLVPLLNMRLARPARLVDINGLDGELGRIEAAADGGLRLGALVRQTELATSSLVRERAPLLAEAARHIGHRAIRNRGTLGGSLAHADPAAELPAAVVALGATLVLAGPGGTRAIPADEFFQGVYLTALRPEELLVEVQVPATDGAGAGWAFAEVARRTGDFALAGVAGVLRPTGQACLVGLGVADAPLRLRQAEACVADQPIDPTVAAAAGRAAAAECDPPADVHASAAYRRHLLGVLIERVLLQTSSRIDRP